MTTKVMDSHEAEFYINKNIPVLDYGRKKCNNKRYWVFTQEDIRIPRLEYKLFAKDR